METSEYSLPDFFDKETELETSPYELPEEFNKEIEMSEIGTQIEPEIPKIIETSSYILPDEIEILSIDEIPQVQISQEELNELPKANNNEEEEFKENLVKICGDNEQLNEDDNNCYSCEYYNLIWDPELKKCKKMEKPKEELALVINKKKQIGYMDISNYPYGDYKRRHAYSYKQPLI